ncbi:hypothetical protein, partial [Neptuniibacter sp.]|uniref:hypothetical protein n=1 Tax=Neptuniibacter sp. TaxID=1962643 RepID=UPI002607227A
VIAELLHRHEGALSIFVAVLIFYSVAVFLFKQFLNGGIYHTFLSTSGVDIREFFAESGAQFRGNLKISFLMLFLYTMLAIIALTISALLPSNPIGHYGAAAFGSMFTKLILFYLFLISGSILSDILRFRLAAVPEQKFMEHLRPSVNFYLRRFVKLHSIYYLYFVPMVVLWLIVEKMALVVTGGLGNMIGVFLELVMF